VRQITARRKRPAGIIAKVNALLDQPMIEAPYRASQAGVEIDLIVRGACALRPNIRRLSHRIRVRSIVGRFLEHSRIFYFENGGTPEIYLGSADWMPRNLYERVAVMFRLRDPSPRQRVYLEILLSYLRDNGKDAPSGCGWQVQSCVQQWLGTKLPFQRSGFLETGLQTVPAPPPLAMSAD
jgi:polyphosphate kinase